MQTKQSIQIIILVASVLLAIMLSRISCQQIPPSEPYSHHFDPYSYGYESEDNHGNKQWKQERSNRPHEVHGSYGYRDHHGIYREVTYVADQNGFRANIKTNEPGVTGSDKSPASTKVESYYSPSASPSQLIMTAIHPVTQQYTQLASHSHQVATVSSPPVYARQHYAPPTQFY
jgi:hypothetical protein